MGEGPVQAEWFYVGHYGQLGPLTYEQICELARDGVIAHDTFVWKHGMGDWRPAIDIPDLRPLVAPTPSGFAPPPVPGSLAVGAPPVAPTPAYTGQSMVPAQGQWRYLEASVPKSDKNRTTAGLLNLIPGVGRFYLGYAAHGALQLVAALCGIGYLWSVIDGIYILMGGVKYDGYGRLIQD